MQERIKQYNEIPYYCGKDYLYSKNNGIEILNCKSFRCLKCRKEKIKSLLPKITNICLENDLTRHLIITFKGKELRNKISPNNSYDYTIRKFHNIHNSYRSKYGKGLKYICMNRSQENGYSHLHILINKYIPKEWLQKQIDKHNLGFFKIKHVDIHRISNYLSKYWYKEHEWYIPKDKRHFSTSKNIKINDNYNNDEYYYIEIYGYDEIYFEIYRWFIAVMLKPPPNSFYINSQYLA